MEYQVHIYMILVTPMLAFATSPVSIESLPDGVSVKGGEPLKTVEASWHVYVTLDPPELPQLLVNRVIDLKTILVKLRKTYGSEIKLDSHYFKRAMLLNKMKVVFDYDQESTDYQWQQKQSDAPPTVSNLQYDVVPTIATKLNTTVNTTIPTRLRVKRG